VPTIPVQPAVEPGLHSDEAVNNIACALFGRALPGDFLDVDAAVMSGRYTREQLLELAAETAHGFDRLLFADALGANADHEAALASPCVRNGKKTSSNGPWRSLPVIRTLSRWN
jgi:hypothetical protein